MRLRSIAPWFVALALPGLAHAQTPTQLIQSSGPITAIYAGADGSAQIIHGGGAGGVFYPSAYAPADHGTFVSVAGALYTPDFAAHPGSAAASAFSGTPAMTALQQSTVMGAGTAGDPFRVVTIYQVGSTGLKVTQTDDYVVGQESYSTTMLFENSTMAAIPALVYRAADCFIAGADASYGIENAASKSVGCAQNANNDPPALVVQFQPITSGNTYFQGSYNEVWSRIGSQQPFPDTCQCTSRVDSGAGLAWQIEVPPMGSTTVAHVTTFEPDGTRPVQSSLAAFRTASVVGSGNGYTVTLTNPNEEPVTLTSIISQLPAGFEYVIDSTSGAITANPTINGASLQWSGTFNLPANTSLTFRFQVTVSSSPGMYFGSVGGVAADGFAVTPSTNAAPISVVELVQRGDASVREDATLGSLDAASRDASGTDATPGRDASGVDAAPSADATPSADAAEAADAGVGDLDAGEVVDSGETSVLTEDEGGCGCNTSTRDATGGVPALALLLGLACLTRRRR